MRLGRAKCWLIGAIFLSLTAKAQNLLPGEPENLPYGVFPSISTILDVPISNENLPGELKDLSQGVATTAKVFATRRNVTCFYHHPCLLQAFPILYNSSGSGFFGGFRANITDVERDNPKLYSADLLVVRSDTQQWQTGLGLDAPQIEFLPFTPRIKLHLNYSRTTDIYYFGTGASAAASIGRPSNELRYSLQERGFQNTVLVPLGPRDYSHAALIGLLETIQHDPSRLSADTPSKLYEDNPLGVTGGTATGLGGGVVFDYRDAEWFTRTGWELEITAQKFGPPLGIYYFQRYSVIERQYVSFKRSTLAMRFTADVLAGEVPFWELAAVGGIDPIRDVASPEALRVYAPGRYYERNKFIASFDHRYHLSTNRLFGAVCDTVWVPIGVDLGVLGHQKAWSLSTGANILFNRSFQIRALAGYAPTGYGVRLAFGENF